MGLPMSDLLHWGPNKGAQEAFLKSTAFEVLYGGAAGGAKSESLLMAPLRWVGRATFRGLIMRRTFPELEKTLIDRSRQLYPQTILGASYNAADKCWTFPGGAKIYFGHCEHEHDVYRYQGAEFQYLALDELTLFTERIYTYLITRMRSSQGIPIRVRNATNPGGPGHEWVKERWGPWLDPDCAVKVEPGKVLYYRNVEGKAEWCEPSPHALSRVFIPAKLSDNPHLLVNDPAYAQRLEGLDYVTRKRLLEGDWQVQEAAGDFFDRTWFEVVDALPADVHRCRWWDRAATKDGDWTAGVLMARSIKEGCFYVEDVIRFRGGPSEVRRAIVNTAQQDGHKVKIGLPQDPGQAGVFEISSYAKELVGWVLETPRETGDKVTRARPFASQCRAGNVKIKRALWNRVYLDELQHFPKGQHDDQVDASSGGFAILHGSGVGAYSAAMARVRAEMRGGRKL